MIAAAGATESSPNVQPTESSSGSCPTWDWRLADTSSIIAC
jgi:hypothetical protein